MVTSTPPGSDIALFSDDVLADPYEAYAELRKLGPVVRLDHYGCWATTGFEAARQVLLDWPGFSSARGIGLNDAVNSMDRDSVLMSDPPRHDVLRGVLIERLGPRALRAAIPAIEKRADEMVAAAVATGNFDVVPDIARRLPVEVMGDLIGLPAEGREELLALADGTFNSFGPDNERSRAGMDAWPALAQVVARIATRDRLTAGSLGLAVYEAADAGVLEPQECLTMLGTYLNAGMDTTVNAIAAAVALLAKHPDQWRLLRSGAVTAAAALEEAIRYESPVQSFGRMTVEERVLTNVLVPIGQRVVVQFGSANRDPAQWDRPDDFNIARPVAQHLGFGIGVHGCAGQALARIEGTAVLRSLAARAEHLTLTQSTWHLNNVIRGLETARVDVT